jgi:hypothetical protein
MGGILRLLGKHIMYPNFVPHTTYHIPQNSRTAEQQNSRTAEQQNSRDSLIKRKYFYPSSFRSGWKEAMYSSY